MPPLVIDSECLATIRTLVSSGDIPASLAAIDLLTTRSPVQPANAATSKQTWCLRNLTGKDVRPLILTFDEASRMIGELMETGETTHKETHYRTTATADKYRAKRINTTETAIPF